MSSNEIGTSDGQVLEEDNDELQGFSTNKLRGMN